MIRKAIILSLAFLMQFSLCTGGIFVNSTLAIGKYIAGRADASDVTRMTSANIGYLTCQSSGKQPLQSVDHAGQTGCQNSSSCLAREHTRVRDQQMSLFSLADSIIPVSYFNDLPAQFARRSPFWAVERPPGELAFHGLPSTVKLE